MSRSLFLRSNAEHCFNCSCGLICHSNAHIFHYRNSATIRWSLLIIVNKTNLSHPPIVYNTVAGARELVGDRVGGIALNRSRRWTEFRRYMMLTIRCCVVYLLCCLSRLTLRLTCGSQDMSFLFVEGASKVTRNRYWM